MDTNRLDTQLDLSSFNPLHPMSSNRFIILQISFSTLMLWENFKEEVHDVIGGLVDMFGRGTSY
jgi:hypothetical protein